MKAIKASLLTLSIFLFGCTNTSQPENNKSTEANKTTHTDHTGNYVSSGYSKRTDGYDWVAVKVQQVSETEVSIKVRSRADKKKPTCTFDTKATKLNDSTYQAISNGNHILFSFQGESVRISPKEVSARSMLHFYCSGGASLEGVYTKINEPLDSNVDPTIYSNVLMLQGIGFNISTIAEGDEVKLTIAPFGLSEDNTPLMKNIKGEIIHSEIEDLNSDDFPELLVFTQDGADETGNVEAVSVNNGKSMSFAYFRPTAEDSRINSGYQGHDEFSLVENKLRQRFPIYENGKPTDRTRQVMYTLKDGEAMRFFDLENVSEY